MTQDSAAEMRKRISENINAILAGKAAGDPAARESVRVVLDILSRAVSIIEDADIHEDARSRMLGALARELRRLGAP